MDETMVQEDQRVMTGTAADERSIMWIPTDPWLVGDPELAAKVSTNLFVKQVQDGVIAVTPTGPSVPAELSNKMAVFASANEVTNFGLTWINPPDVSFGNPPGTVY